MEITMDGLLKNNSDSMGTIVETFIIEETVGLIYDNEELEKWNKHVEELGLSGQTQIVKPDKSPIPFMHMKTNLVAVFETLCPTKTDIKAYNITPIPVEILDLIALSVKEQYFDKLQIWYDNKSPDPVCIGMVYESEEDRLKKYDWRMNHYLLGKWADVKHSFETLTKMATKRYKQERKSQLESSIKMYQRELEDLETAAFNKFGSDVNGHDDLLF